MTVKVWKVSDADLTLQKTIGENDILASYPVAVLPSFIFQDRFINQMRWPMPSVDSCPPWRAGTSVAVLRV